MENIYYARSANEQGQKETVFHHLSRASELCQEFLSPLGYGAWGEVLGKFHDFGKYSEDFQQVLRREKTHVNHAGPGAALVFQAYGGWSHGGKGQNRAAKLLASVIASHHGELSLVDDGVLKRVLRGEGDRLDSEGRRFSLFGQEEFRDAVSLWKSAFTPPRLSPPLPAFSDGEDASLARMLWTRFLFSALVDADYSSAAEHQKPDYLLQNQGPELDPEEALQRLSQVQAEKKQGSTAASTLNVMRNQLFDDCLAAAAQEPGLFTLTAPTGLGKTLSLFAFAAEHCRIYGKRRIILILPFLAIIEQNVKDYRKVVPDLLEIHSNAQLDERARLLSERWDAPCIVTTSVGFFQPLFSAKPADCRHLHQLANSVLVLDEAQSLPPHLLDATLRTVKLLCTQYGCTVVFSTATQPSFGYRPGLSWQPREIGAGSGRTICGDTAGDRGLAAEAADIPGGDCRGSGTGKSGLCHCQPAGPRQGPVPAAGGANGGGEYIFPDHGPLSGPPAGSAPEDSGENAGRTSLPPGVYPMHRGRCGSGFSGGIPGAGAVGCHHPGGRARCNRNGDSPTGRVIVFVPEEEKLYPSSAYENAANCVRVLASRHPIDCNDLSHIQEYYQLLYSQSEGDKQALRQAVEAEDFLEVQHAYQIIENTGLQVVVPCPGEEKLYQEVKARYEKEGLTPALMRLAGPHYRVQLPERLGPAVLRTAVLPRLGTRRDSCGDGLLSVRHS